MCEFKIIKQNDNNQIAEDILVLSYNDNNELLIKDILGMGIKIDSALILDVNTLTQKCMILEHPLVNDFIRLIKDLTSNSANTAIIQKMINNLEDLKSSL
ncbi:MAG: hypothetical protein ACFFBP_22005 [Promethearchaeota archaeon]